MKIKDIRKTINALYLSRLYSTGGTSEENKKTDLPFRLRLYLLACRALEIPARFAADIAHRDEEVATAERVIQRWYDRNGIVSFPIRVEVQP